MIALNIDVASDLSQCGKHFQTIGMHFNVTLSKRKIRVDMLIAVECLIQNLDGAFDDGTVTERIDITRMYDARV